MLAIVVSNAFNLSEVGPVGPKLPVGPVEDAPVAPVRPVAAAPVGPVEGAPVGPV